MLNREAVYWLGNGRLHSLTAAYHNVTYNLTLANPDKPYYTFTYIQATARAK